MKVASSKIVNRMVSNTKRIKNKLIKNGREEFENEDTDEMPTTGRILKSKKSAKND